MEIYVPLITSLLLLTAVLQPTQQIFPITSKSDLVDVIYPPQAHSERGLPFCEPNAVCNILQRRFWFRMRIERVCRCSPRLECPMEWNHKRNNQTMTLNNRSQLKFCEPVSELPQCSSQSQAITVKTRTVTESHTHQEVLPFSNTQTTITAACNCPPKHYWKLNRKLNHDYDNGTVETSTIYRCARLRKCNAMEFCGNIRADYYFTYYQCSCPMGHMCLQKDQKKYQVSELLYNSTAYRAVCTPNNS